VQRAQSESELFVNLKVTIVSAALPLESIPVTHTHRKRKLHLLLKQCMFPSDAYKLIHYNLLQISLENVTIRTALLQCHLTPPWHTQSYTEKTRIIYNLAKHIMTQSNSLYFVITFIRKRDKSSCYIASLSYWQLCVAFQNFCMIYNLTRDTVLINAWQRGSQVWNSTRNKVLKLEEGTCTSVFNGKLLTAGVRG